ncbi:MAG TPA: hypothetical protein VGB74_10845, partial [Actinoplanes sp.]
MSAPALPPADADSDPLVWLALPPVWTGAAALHTSFPAPGKGAPGDRDTSLLRLVDRAVAAGSAACRGGLTAARFPYATFWLTDDARAAVLARAVRHHGRLHLQILAQQIARELRRLPDDHPVPSVVRDWITLVTGETQLVERVLGLCHDGRADQVASAHRQVTLAHRLSHDLESLRDFQDRPDWTERVTALITKTAPDDPWALHLLGRGGTGKTMFIRYLASGRFAREHGLGTVPMARVDFDHLNPEYPIRRPVQLLVEFAEELAPYVAKPGDGVGPGDRAAALDAFLSIAKSAEATGSGPAGAHLVDQATKAFARFVAALPQPVVLILDTCEELARRAPDDGPNPAVRAMLDRLRLVQATVPAVRVLLSGRRRLGVVEAGLAVFEVHGFRDAEAGQLLKRRYHGKVMPAKLRRTILALSPEHGPAPGGGPAHDRAAPRYSPYDLAMYWRWWTADPSIKPDDLLQNRRSDYIDARIVPRLGDRLRRWLPAVALLGRFDARMLAPANPDVREADADAVVREFARLEWTDTDTDPASRSPIVEIDRGLQPHLLDWARATDRRRFDETRDRLAAALIDGLRARPLGQISTAHVLSALRLSGRDAALHVWAEVERRVAREDGWAWLAGVGPRVLGEVPEDTHPGAGDGIADNRLLAAAVDAAMIGLTRRDDPGRDLGAEWARVAAAAGRASQPVAVHLRWRARLAHARHGPAPSTAAEVAALARLVAGAQPHRGHLAAGVVALAEALAENRLPGVDLGPVAEAARGWLTTVEDPVVRAALRVYLGQLARSGGQPPDEVAVAEDFSLARAAADARAARPGDGHHPDWTPPSHCGVWVSLHAARDAFAAGRPLESLPLVEWERQAEAALHLIDGDRLMSLCLRLRMGYGVVPRDRLDAIRARDRHDPGRAATRAVHHLVPPL